RCATPIGGGGGGGDPPAHRSRRSAPGRSWREAGGVTGVLHEIVAHKREELEDRRRRLPLREVRRRAETAGTARPFGAALSGPPIRLIAEVKGASPSAGAVRPGVEPAEIARGHGRAGAAAISVLTDSRYFHGADGHLLAVRAAVRVPVLRKDFIVDAYQVYEARALGADAVLLIVAALAAPPLADLQRLTHELGMAALVEVHTAAGLDTALAGRAPLIGSNNRNLDQLATP